MSSSIQIPPLLVYVCVALLLTLALAGAETLCSDPGLQQNSVRTTQGFDVGDVVTYSCVRGYTLHTGDVQYVLECLDDGNWNGSAPICEVVTCEEPVVIENADMAGGNEYAQEVTYTCHVGHRKPDGSRITRMTCKDDGTWSRVPQLCNAVRCPTPETIPFSNRTQGDFYYDEVVEYTCFEGYLWVSGNKTLRCGADGYWEGKWPQCNEIRCGDPGLIGHSGRDITGVGFNATVTYRCVRGYERDVTGGELIRNCQADEQWSGAQPQCVGVLCGDPGDVANATRAPVVPTFRYPETLRFTCDVGYKADYSSGGIGQVTCTWEGRWDFAPMNCTRVRCLETNYSVNTEILNGHYYYSDVKNMFCLPGYERESGSLSRTCLETGRFSDSVPVCKKKDCGDPGAISDGEQKFDTNTTDYRGRITYTCEYGYEIEGETASIKRTIICEETGQWSKPAPNCRRVSCGRATVGVNMEVVQDEGNFYGDEHVISCNYGYQLKEGDANRTCKANKVWSGRMPVCQGVLCGEPTPPSYSKLIGKNFRYPHQVYFTCLEGFRKKGGDEKWSCQADAQWLGASIDCQRIKCYPPDTIPNADLSTIPPGHTDFRFEDLITYTCREGHQWSTTSGPLNRTCESNRMWSGKRPVCERISCGDPGDADGAYKLGISFKYRDYVNYTCKTGYEVEDGVSWSVLTCESNTSWSGAKPDCQRVFCGDPGPPGNYSGRTVHGLYFGDSVKYHCVEGYYVVGISDIRCMEDKEWSHPVPNCTMIPNFKPLAPLPPPDPPSEAKDATMVGYIGLSLVIAEVSVMILLDLTTICRDFRILKRNISAGIRELRTRVRPKSANQVGSAITLTSTLEDVSSSSDSSSEEE